MCDSTLPLRMDCAIRMVISIGLTTLLLCLPNSRGEESIYQVLPPVYNTGKPPPTPVHHPPYIPPHQNLQNPSSSTFPSAATPSSPPLPLLSAHKPPPNPTLSHSLPTSNPPPPPSSAHQPPPHLQHPTLPSPPFRHSFHPQVHNAIPPRPPLPITHPKQQPVSSVSMSFSHSKIGHTFPATSQYYRTNEPTTTIQTHIISDQWIPVTSPHHRPPVTSPTRLFHETTTEFKVADSTNIDEVTTARTTRNRPTVTTQSLYETSVISKRPEIVSTEKLPHTKAPKLPKTTTAYKLPATTRTLELVSGAKELPATTSYVPSIVTTREAPAITSTSKLPATITTQKLTTKKSKEPVRFTSDSTTTAKTRRPSNKSKAPGKTRATRKPDEPVYKPSEMPLDPNLVYNEVWKDWSQKI
ncbi:proteoglycan 4-like [Palaemon carinicauda]|uniref:proteoglycan 4-like n=1 Tax=Palaemon carinicauda TaxID=392227 RepID=UPI0035B697AA